MHDGQLRASDMACRRSPRCFARFSIFRASLPASEHHKVRNQTAGAGMAKGQKKSSREAKKPKKPAAEKSAAGGISGSLGIVSISMSGSSYKERFKEGHNA
jgi:hypothetical protein